MNYPRHRPFEFEYNKSALDNPSRIIAGFLAVASTPWAVLLTPFMFAFLFLPQIRGSVAEAYLWLLILIAGYFVYGAWWYLAWGGSTHRLNRILWCCSLTVNIAHPIAFGVFMGTTLHPLIWLWWSGAVLLSLLGWGLEG